MSVYRLQGKIQHYPWGGHSFIPQLLGIKAEPGVTYAEYWMGAHASAPSELLAGPETAVSLAEAIRQRPAETLNPEVAASYHGLPYLFKILDVQSMLSIQVHPTKAQAVAGFAAENARGMPLNDPKRNYKDDNHKPELMVALSDCWLLHGFRPPEEMLQLFESTPEFGKLRQAFVEAGYEGLYKAVAYMPPAETGEIWLPLRERALQKCAGRDDEALKQTPDFWALRAPDPGKDHPGLILSLYFFNVVHVTPGQALFQGAGVPHAYLEGQNAEIMANSDNVLRAGFTEKHVDLPELIKTVKFEGITPAVTAGVAALDNSSETCYPAPVADFALSQIRLAPDAVYRHAARSVEILLVMAGQVKLAAGSATLALERGQSAALFAGQTYTLQAAGGDARLFRAAVGGD